MIDLKLKDKVVLVTGANHGIGAATAKAFAFQKASVFITYLRLPLDKSIKDKATKVETPGEALYRRKQAESADEVVKAIRKKGGKVKSWEADLSDSTNIPKLFDCVEATFGGVDILVNNAAHSASDTFIPQEKLKSEDRSVGGFQIRTLTAQTHDEHFAINSRAVALMIAEFTRRHIKRGAKWGRIINVSTEGAPGFSGEISYGASKYALESYSRAAAVELGKYGITVNIVSPGPIQTGYITPSLEEKLKSKVPLGRIGQPEDVADVIAFLASEQARYLTGQILYVGGGHRMI